MDNSLKLSSISPVASTAEVKGNAAVSFSQDPAFDADRIAQQLAEALRSEQRHTQTEAAKFRAVAQGLDYDGFKEMVAAAHLRPVICPKHGGATTAALHIASGSRKTETPVTSLGCTTSPFTKERASEVERAQSQRDSLVLSTAADTVDLHSLAAPRNLTDFSRDWQRYGSTSLSRAADYLHACVRPERLARIFRSSLDSDVLVRIVQALHTGLTMKVPAATSSTIALPPTTTSPVSSSLASSTTREPSTFAHALLSECRYVYDMLLGLSQLPRFDLVLVLNSSDRTLTLQLFDWLLRYGCSQPAATDNEEDRLVPLSPAEVEQLRGVYCS